MTATPAERARRLLHVADDRTAVGRLARDVAECLLELDRLARPLTRTFPLAHERARLRAYYERRETE